MEPDRKLVFYTVYIRFLGTVWPEYDDTSNEEFRSVQISSYSGQTVCTFSFMIH